MFNRLLNLFRRKKDVKKRTKVSRRDDSQKVGRSSEEICGIDPTSMSKDKIRKRLAKLYKRHNEAVSSLNPDLRKEARQTLEAIVDCRNRYVGE